MVLKLNADVLINSYQTILQSIKICEIFLKCGSQINILSIPLQVYW